MANDSNDSKTITIGPRRISNNICACFCCDTIDGTKRWAGTFIPRLSPSESQEGAPSQTTSDGEWTRRFDSAVEELAKIATEYRTHNTNAYNLGEH